LVAGTKIVHRWVVSDQPMRKLRKIQVIAVRENDLIRKEFEDGRKSSSPNPSSRG
jgi:hypothetical protein